MIHDSSQSIYDKLQGLARLSRRVIAGHQRINLTGVQELVRGILGLGIVYLLSLLLLL